MAGLGIVWLVHAETGSFGGAGLVTGSFAVAETLVGPQTARLVDRHGQPRVLVPLLGAHAAAITGLVALAMTGAPAVALMAAGLAAGATIPQFGALSAARWSALLHGRPELTPAFALETMSNEVAFLLGPALAVLAATQVHPAAGTVLAGALVVGAGLAFAAARGTAAAHGAARACGTAPVPAEKSTADRTAAGRTGVGRTGVGRTGVGRTGVGCTAAGPADPGRTAPEFAVPDRTVPDRTAPDRTAPGPTGARRRGVLFTRDYAPLLAVNLALGVFFGSMQVSVSAFADVHHVASAAGFLYGMMSVASLLAGLVYGRHRPGISPAAQLPLILAFLACASLLPLLADAPWQLGLALLLPGAGIAPCMIVSSTLVESVIDRSVLTQALTWANSASAAGIAVSAAAVGRLVDGPGGPRAGFTVPLLALTAAAALTWCSRHALTTATVAAPATTATTAAPATAGTVAGTVAAPATAGTVAAPATAAPTAPTAPTATAAAGHRPSRRAGTRPR